jgi:hypothetical protein
MKRFLSMIAGACALGMVAACSMSKDSTASSAQPVPVTGILIDQACGSKMMAEADPEKAAADHPKSCATKADCAASGYSVISGKEMLKFDDNGNLLAKEYLQKTPKEDDLRVNVQGTREGDTIAVTSITAADDMK